MFFFFFFLSSHSAVKLKEHKQPSLPVARPIRSARPGPVIAGHSHTLPYNRIPPLQRSGVALPVSCLFWVMRGSLREGQRPPVFLLCLLFGMAALSQGVHGSVETPLPDLRSSIPPHVHRFSSRPNPPPTPMFFFSSSLFCPSFHLLFSVILGFLSIIRRDG